MANPSLSKISKNEMEPMYLEPATEIDDLYDHFQDRDTLFPSCRSIFGNRRHVSLMIGLCSIVVVAISFTSYIEQPSENGPSLDRSSSSSWPPPKVTLNDDLEIQTWKYLDIDRPRKLFRPEFESGVTYMQKIDLEIREEFPLNGKGVSSHTHMAIENSMSVSDTSGGGKKFDITLNRVAAIKQTIGLEMRYDSNESDNERSPLTAALDGLVGKSTTIETDNNYQIMRANHTLLPGNKESSENKISSGQFEQVNRMTKTLPKEPVQPGDEWDVQIKLEDSEEFDGKAQLVGYIEYNGVDCAVIRMNGAVNSSDTIKSLEGNSNDNESLQSINTMPLKDGKMTSVMYWDHEENIAQFTVIFMSKTITMNNPVSISLNLSDHEEEPLAFIDVPSQEHIEIYAGIKK